MDHTPPSGRQSASSRYLLLPASCRTQMRSTLCRLTLAPTTYPSGCFTAGSRRRCAPPSRTSLHCILLLLAQAPVGAARAPSAETCAPLHCGTRRRLAGGTAINFAGAGTINCCPPASILPPAPLQALVKFAPGTTQAAKGRALARGQATEEEVVVQGSVVGGELVRIRFNDKAGKSTGKAAREIEADPSVEYAEVSSCLDARAGSAQRGFAAANRPLPLRRRSSTISSPPCSKQYALPCTPPVRVVQPNYIYTHQAVSNDAYYTSGSLWGMLGAATSPANQWGSNAAAAWAQGYTGDSTVYIGEPRTVPPWQRTGVPSPASRGNPPADHRCIACHATGFCRHHRRRLHVRPPRPEGQCWHKPWGGCGQWAGR